MIREQSITRERRVLVQMALGRLFRMGSRPFQLGDHEDYEWVREIIMEESDVR